MTGVAADGPAGERSQAGPSVRCDPAGVPVASSGDWPDDPAERADLESRWDPILGDRHQELVFIGIGLDGDGQRTALDGALLTGAELAAAGAGLSAGLAAWSTLPDRFPEWEVGELDEHGHVSSQTAATSIASR